MLEQGDNPNPNEPTPPPAEESSNRTFLIAAGILAGVVFLSIVCLAGYALFLGPRLTAQRNAQQAVVETQNAQIAAAMTETAVVSQWTATPQPSPLATITSTPVVAIPSNTATSINDPLTATMAALQTQVAIAQLTPTSTLVTLPKGGFADEFGLPGLLLVALALVVVIFLARRLRTAPTR